MTKETKSSGNTLYKTKPHKKPRKSVRRSLRAALLALVAFPMALMAAEDGWKTPKTSFGHPDLQGTWTNATVTMLERPKQFGDQLVLSPELGKQMEENNPFARMKELDSRPTDPNAPAPTAGQGVGGYNAFWMDPGERVVQIDGEYRTSIVTAPKDGQIPYTPKGRKKFVEGYAVRNSEIGRDGPELRALGERCLVGFGSTGGPPMLPVLYNNHYQIVQTPEHVAILVEMNHDARIIRLDDEHRPPEITPWLGDSIGRWEGDTLVVETTNFHPLQEIRSATRHRIYIPSDAVVTERFTRVGPDKINYQFTVEHDEAYTQSWSGEMPLYQTDEKIFEYACHEGNYSLPGILSGGRQEEREAAGKKKK